jgi:hypothetical protein
MTNESSQIRNQANPGADAIETAVQQAWNALRQGAPDHALHISHQLLSQRLVRRARLPWLQASLVVSLRDHLIGRSDLAADRLYQVLSVDPGSDWAMQLYLSALRDELNRRQNDQPEGTILLGLGTGRSGSTSLSYLLSAQHDTCFSHEHAPLIPWYGGERQLQFHLDRMSLLARMFGFVADVSHWWLPKLDAVIARFPNARVVVTQRDRAETMASFLSIKGGDRSRPINHWMAHDGVQYLRNLWDVCYPKYKAGSLQEALGLYWDDYYQKAAQMQARYPSNVRVFDVQALSSPQGQRQILQFWGYPHPVILADARRNVGSTKDGALFWRNPFNPAF